LNYNLLERSLFGLFSHHLEKAGLTFKECQFLIGTMNTKERLDTIRFLFLEREQDTQVRERVNDLIAYFNRCAENRNILAHATLDNRLEKRADGGWHSVEDEHGMEVWKSSKDDWSKINRYRLTLTDLRRIADEMHAGYLFAFRLWLHLAARDDRLGALSRLARQPLPETLPPPRSLTILPPHPVPDSEPPSPRSSPA
jgi:hypothetical protein